MADLKARIGGRAPVWHDAEPGLIPTENLPPPNPSPNSLLSRMGFTAQPTDLEQASHTVKVSSSGVTFGESRPPAQRDAPLATQDAWRNGEIGYAQKDAPDTSKVKRSRWQQSMLDLSDGTSSVSFRHALIFLSIIGPAFDPFFFCPLGSFHTSLRPMQHNSSKCV
jgi:hypothetical protein